MLSQLLVFPLRVLIFIECAVLGAIVMPFLVIGRLFGLIEPAHLPS